MTTTTTTKQREPYFLFTPSFPLVDRLACHQCVLCCSFYLGFLRGGLAACVGAAFSHPLDVLKVRLQVQGEGGGGVKLGPVGMAKHIFKSDGVAGLYAGLSASLLRQAVYSSTRFGMYDVLKGYFEPKDGTAMGFGGKIGCGMGAGAIAAVVGNPADVAMIRMQADGRLPHGHADRRNYRGVADALTRIAKEEGVVAGLWRGILPTINRAMIVTAGQLATYDQFKEALLQTGYFKENRLTHFTASFLAGFVATVVSNPIDVVKTRIMNQPKTPIYKGQIDCAVKTVRAEGVLALYKGFVPMFVRQAPYVIVTFMSLEQLKKYI